MKNNFKYIIKKMLKFFIVNLSETEFLNTYRQFLFI